MRLFLPAAVAAEEEDEAGCRNSDARFSKRWWIGEVGAVGPVVVDDDDDNSPVVVVVVVVDGNRAVRGADEGHNSLMGGGCRGNIQLFIYIQTIPTSTFLHIP